jgi:hypothetical protein
MQVEKLTNFRTVRNRRKIPIADKPNRDRGSNGDVTPGPACPLATEIVIPHF